ncbi:MAG TPA: CHASE2 domain-containing protein [Flavobacterium sp.]|nr:CHASE2 domain-containing protein [Flavobacterium sp.]
MYGKLKAYFLKKDRKPIRFKSLLLVYTGFLLFAVGFTYLLEHLDLELYRIKELAIEDIDITDIHYQYEDTIFYHKRKDITIINSGSLTKGAEFRKQLIVLIGKLKSAKKIGLDLYFPDSLDTMVTKKLGRLLSERHIVFGVNKQEKSIFLSAPHQPFYYGLINLPDKEHESVREYYNCYRLPVIGSPDLVTVNSFARAMVDPEIKKHGESTFFIKYCSKDKGFYNVMVPDMSEDRKSNFPAIEGKDLMEDKVPPDSLKKYIEGKIIIVGHLGSFQMNNPLDMNDKHRVPVDFELIKREPTMPGVVIQANAVQMLLDGNKVYAIKGFWCLLIVSILLFFYLLAFMQIHKMRHVFYMLFIEVALLILSILGLMRLSIALMCVNVHFNMGIMLLGIALLIEFKLFAFIGYDWLVERIEKKEEQTEVAAETQGT